MSKYNRVLLNEIAIISTGFPFKGNLYANDGIRVVRGENITIGSLRWDSTKCWKLDFEQAPKYLLKNNDIVIGMDGSRVGKNRAIIKQDDLPLLLAQRVACIRNNEFSNQIFLYYLIMSDSFVQYVNKTQTGSSIPHISQSQIENFIVPFPDLSTQQKIASVLSSLDSKIELNNRINAELEAMAKTLYDYWFVQFDFPNAEGKPYKSSGGTMVWSEELKREIPERWRVGELKDMISLLIRGISPKYIDKDGIIVLNQRCIRDQSINPKFGRRHDYLSKNVDSKLIAKGDILVNSTGVGTLGRAAIVKDLPEELTTVDSHVTIVRIDETKANPLFTGYNLLQKEKEIEALGEGSTGQTELSRENLGKLKLILPEDNLQESFASFLEPLYQKIATNEQENQQLAHLRDWLLPMLMNGQVVVE